MDLWKLLLWIPAIVSGTAMLGYIWPGHIKPHAVPVITFLVALVVLKLPEYPDLALALMPVVAIVQKFLGISLTDHEPLKLPEMKKLRAQVDKISSSKTPLVNFVQRGYGPAGQNKPVKPPETAADEPEPEKAPAPLPKPSVSPTGRVKPFRSFIPALPD